MRCLALIHTRMRGPCCAHLQHNGYMQWPDHCLRGTFSARIDAGLHYPKSAVVVKKGYAATNDS